MTTSHRTTGSGSPESQGSFVKFWRIVFSTVRVVVLVAAVIAAVLHTRGGSYLRWISRSALSSQPSQLAAAIGVNGSSFMLMRSATVK